MYLYLSQDIHNGYDTYDSCIVAAESEDEARCIYPSEDVETIWDQGSFAAWAHNPSQVKVKLIGEAINCKKGVILASYNAG